MWLYKHKFGADGTIRRHKSRLVANEKSQEHGLDYDETFSPMVKPVTIRSVLHLALQRYWEVYHLDVKNAFLHDKLEETIYMQQPPDLKDESRPHHVCKLEKALYGLKQAPVLGMNGSPPLLDDWDLWKAAVTLLYTSTAKATIRPSFSYMLTIYCSLLLLLCAKHWLLFWSRNLRCMMRAASNYFLALKLTTTNPVCT